MTGFVGIIFPIMFPFTQISDDELHYLSIDDNLIDLYDNCSGLNYEPFKCSETNEYFTTDKIDPDNNVHNKLDVSSLYYTEEQFKNKYRSSDGFKDFSLIHFNCRSLSSNFSKLKDSVLGLEMKFDVIALSETWLKDNDNTMFEMEGYNNFVCSRTDKSGGGVALYINDSLQHRYLPDKSIYINNCAEIVSVEITLRNGKKVIICCIYRAPNTDLNTLSEFINYILSNIGKRTVYMCGDFNVDLLQYDKHADTNDFIDQLYSLGLHPLITRPTRITSHSKTLIDNIFTTDLSSHIHSGLIINDMSDHLPIYQITENSYKTSNDLGYSKKKVVNEETVGALVNDLKEINWNTIIHSEDVNFMYNNFSGNVANLYNKNCPIVTNKVKGKNSRVDKSWMTKSLKNACRKKNLLYRQFLKKRTEECE